MTKRKQIKPAPDKIVGSQYITYEGKLKVTTMHGNRALSTKEYSNNGLPPLFKFLTQAVGGYYTKELRPCKIKLFNVPETVKYKDFSWGVIFGNEEAKKAIEVSDFINYDVAPVVKKVLNEGQSVEGLDNYHYEVIYHFRIPYAYISGDIIKVVGLYPEATVNNEEASAFYAFTKKENNIQVWDPLTVSDLGGSSNYSIIIDWTMAIMNK